MAELRNIRGLSFPDWGMAVKPPTSMKPKPRFSHAKTFSAFLSIPAARPRGFLRLHSIIEQGNSFALNDNLSSQFIGGIFCVNLSESIDLECAFSES